MNKNINLMESFVQQITNKFLVINNIIQKLTTFISNNYDLLKEFDAIETNFTLYISYQYTSTSYKIYIHNDSSNFLLIEDFSFKLNELLNKIIHILKLNNIHIDDNIVRKYKKREDILIYELQKLINAFPMNITINDPIDTYIYYNRCNICGIEMVLDTNKSELYCNNCGIIKGLVGTVFDDTQFYNQEGQKTKSGTFNPNRHFQFWWTHILAKESEEELGDKKDINNIYGEKVIASIKDIIKRDKKVLQLLTVNDIRSILREIGKTELNKNIPLILKKITGIGPPTIPDHITLRVENLFTKSIEIGEKIKSNKRINRNYYPYYIYRIIEAITLEDDYEIRKILFYIYIQSKETVETDDQDWEQICTELKEIKYKPTDRSLGQKYIYINLTR